jgi:TatD DNase family protein
LEPLAPLIDSHCHLADDVFSGDLETVVDRARAAGLERALVILAAGDEKEATQARRLERLWPAVRFAIGVHPHQAHELPEPGHAADAVRKQLAETSGARAIGEIGLDYHYDFSPRDVQQHVFRSQVALARELQRPVVIHTREADDDTIDILKSEGQGALTGVLHCFTGGPSLARAGLDLGFYISMSGIATFPKAGELRDTLRAVPLERVLVETDSPFLAPPPHRGKRNEPSYVVRVAEMLAEIHGTSLDAVCRQTTANFHALFRD